MPEFLVAVLAALLLPLGSTRAQESRSIDPTIQHVMSGGRWQSGGQSGWYRAIIRTGGFEHIVSNLTVEWIGDDSEPSVMHSVDVKELDGLGRLDAPSLTLRGKTWVLTMQWTDTHGRRAPHRVSLALGPPGLYTLREKP